VIALDGAFGPGDELLGQQRVLARSTELPRLVQLSTRTDLQCFRRGAEGRPALTAATHGLHDEREVEVHVRGTLPPARAKPLRTGNPEAESFGKGLESPLVHHIGHQLGLGNDEPKRTREPLPPLGEQHEIPILLVEEDRRLLLQTGEILETLDQALRLGPGVDPLEHLVGVTGESHRVVRAGHDGGPNADEPQWADQHQITDDERPRAAVTSSAQGAPVLQRQAPELRPDKAGGRGSPCQPEEVGVGSRPGP
jgi:hypothetical protein